MKNDIIEFETIHSNKKRIYFLCGFVCVVVLLVIFIVGRSHAKYRTTQSIPLVNGTINYSLADLNIVAITVEGEASDTIPEGNYELTEISYCTVNGEEDSNIEISYEADTQTLTILPFTTKGTKCYLDFVKSDPAKNTLDKLGLVAKEDTPNFSQTATTDEGMYAAEDNLGTSYYFRGAVENNYVYFAGYYWRIIRINGDGSIRIIYDGTTAHANGESSTDRQIGISAYSEDYNYSYYVGYTYEVGAQRSSTQNGGTASTIKGVLDSWYTINIVNQGLDDRVVSEIGFCNDREMAIGYEWIANPSSTIYYKAYERLATNKVPTLECSNNLDLYTTKVGLITADEVSMAGGVYNTNNTSYYLYTGQIYWTMSPSASVDVFAVNSTGRLIVWGLNYTSSVRPVINLSSDIIITGSGTISDPYTVVGA